MATILSKYATGQIATPVSPGAGTPVVLDYFIDVTAAQLALNNVFDMGILPAGHTVGDMILVPDDLDSGTPTIALDVGLMTGTPGDSTSVRTCGAEFFSADASARTGVAARMSLATGFKVLSSGADRSIGVKVQAAGATPAAGRIRLRVYAHPSDSYIQF